eukprot:scaffold9694_cov28-Attheya_sp.AAC.2
MSSVQCRLYVARKGTTDSRDVNPTKTIPMHPTTHLAKLQRRTRTRYDVIREREDRLARVRYGVHAQIGRRWPWESSEPAECPWLVAVLASVLW